MKTYKQQNKEIQKLLKSISKKSNRFAKAEYSSKYFEDLLTVKNDLEDINNFLK